MRWIGGRFGSATVGVLAAAAGLLSSPVAIADTAERHGLWDRFCFDLGYEVSLNHVTRVVDATSRDPITGRQARAFVITEYNTVSQGLVLNAAFSVRPWVGLGLDGSVHQDFTAPTPDPWLERAGVRFGPRRILGLGPFAEFRPWHRSYAPRQGWFFRVGIRGLWVDYNRAPSSQVVTPAEGYTDDGLGWHAVGYRVALGSGVSFHVQGHVGFGFKLAVAGVRIGGGFH